MTEQSDQVQPRSNLETFYSLDKIHFIPEEFSFFSVSGQQISVADVAIKQLINSKETVTSVNAPIDQVDSDIVYLSTTTASPDGKVPYTNRVYSYHLKTGVLEELYKNDVTSTMAPYWMTVMRTIGSEGSKVILVKDGLSYQSSCLSIWNDFTDYSYLDAANPNSGLFTFTVPQQLIVADKLKKDECLKNRAAEDI